MALLDTLQDNFNDNSIDTGLWTEVENGGALVSEEGKSIILIFPTSTDSSCDGQLKSQTTYNLTNSYALLRIIEVPIVSIPVDCELRIYQDSNNWFRWIWEAGALYAQYKKLGGATQTVTSFSFSTVNHGWVKIREVSGIVYWDTSNDGLTWIERGNFTHGMTINAVTAAIMINAFTSETSPGRFAVDNFNIARETRSSLGNIPKAISVGAGMSKSDYGT